MILDYSMHGEVTDLQMYNGIMDPDKLIALTGKSYNIHPVNYYLTEYNLYFQKHAIRLKLEILWTGEILAGKYGGENKPFWEN